MRVVEATSQKVAFALGVESEKASETVARLPCSGIGEQIHFAGKACERRHYSVAGIVDDDLRNEDRIVEIRKRIVEALRRVHAAKGIKVGFGVGANKHKAVANATGERKTISRSEKWWERCRLLRAGISKNGVAQKRVHESEGFGGGEGGSAGGDAMRSESGLSGG